MLAVGRGGLCAWMVVSPALRLHALFSLIPYSLFGGVILIYNGALLLKYGDKTIKSRGPFAWSYFLWGIHEFLFAYTYYIPWFPPWGLLIADLLALFCSVSALYYYFEMKNRELQWAKQKLEYLSYYDTLTGLFNRNYFEQEIKRLESQQRFETPERTPVGIVLCDVDGLKAVNDTLGHAKGDVLLIQAANVIRSVFAGRGLTARIGGDEFVTVLEAQEDELQQACQQIHRAVLAYNASGPELPLSISVGCASDRAGQDLMQVFKEADNNMYQEKLEQKQKHAAAGVHWPGHS